MYTKFKITSKLSSNRMPFFLCVSLHHFPKKRKKNYNFVFTQAHSQSINQNPKKGIVDVLNTSHQKHFITIGPGLAINVQFRKMCSWMWCNIHYLWIATINYVMTKCEVSEIVDFKIYRFFLCSRRTRIISRFSLWFLVSCSSMDV